MKEIESYNLPEMHSEVIEHRNKIGIEPEKPY